MFTVSALLRLPSVHLIYDSQVSSKFGRSNLIKPLQSYLQIDSNKVILDSVDLNTPPWEREATGFWLDIRKDVIDLMISKSLNPAEAIHAAEHAFLNRFALAKDLKTECKIAEKEYRTSDSQRKRPAR